MAGLVQAAGLLWKAEERLRNRNKPQGILRFAMGWAMAVVIFLAMDAWYSLNWGIRGPFSREEWLAAWLFMGLAYSLLLILSGIGMALKEGPGRRQAYAPLTTVKSMSISFLGALFRHGPAIIISSLLCSLFLLRFALLAGLDIFPVFVFQLTALSIGHALGSLARLFLTIGAKFSFQSPEKEPGIRLSFMYLLQATGLLGFCSAKPAIRILPEEKKAIMIIAGLKTGLNGMLENYPMLLRLALVLLAASLIASFVLRFLERLVMRTVVKTQRSEKAPGWQYQPVLGNLLIVRRPSLLGLDFILSLSFSILISLQAGPVKLSLIIGLIVFINPIVKVFINLGSDTSLSRRFAWCKSSRAEFNYLLAAALAGIIRALPFFIFADPENTEYLNFCCHT